VLEGAMPTRWFSSHTSGGAVGIYLSIYLSIYISIYLSIYLSISISISLSIYTNTKTNTNNAPSGSGSSDSDPLVLLSYIRWRGWIPHYDFQACGGGWGGPMDAINQMDDPHNKCERAEGPFPQVCGLYI